MQEKRGRFSAEPTKPFTSIVNFLANRRGSAIGYSASLLKVFIPYFAVEHGLRQPESGQRDRQTPAQFSEYSYPLLKFSRGTTSLTTIASGRRQGGMSMMTRSGSVGQRPCGSDQARLDDGRGQAMGPRTSLKFLFTGYNGTRNTGADVRVEEMLRQVRHILGDDHAELSVLSQNFEMTRGYFPGATRSGCRTFPAVSVSRSTQVRRRRGVRRLDVQEQVRQRPDDDDDRLARDRVVAEQVGVGYGAEAGHMDPFAKMCRRYCGDSLVITRNEESQAVLGKLGVSTELGTDTAWTFEPRFEYGETALRQTGGTDRRRSWSSARLILSGGRSPIAGQAGRAPRCGAYSEGHYRSFYFHKYGLTWSSYDRYLECADGDRRSFADTCLLIIFGMEALDPRACEMGDQLAVRFLSSFRLRHVSVCEHTALLSFDGLVALSRDRHLHAGSGRSAG